MLFTPKHIFRCEVYGQYVTIKKKTSTPLFHLSLLEVMVNKEPTRKLATHYKRMKRDQLKNPFPADNFRKYKMNVVPSN